MKKVVILTDDLDHAKKSSVVNLMNCKMVTSEDEIAIIHLKKTQIDIVNGERNHYVINAPLGAVNSYIKHAEYVYLGARRLLFDHLVQYLLKDVSADKMISDYTTTYRYCANHGYTSDHICNAQIDITNRVYEDIKINVFHKFNQMIDVYTDLMDLIYTVNNDWFEDIDDLVNEAYENNPDVGFQAHPSFDHFTHFKKPQYHDTAYNEIGYDYIIAQPVSYIRRDDDDFVPFISIAISLYYNSDILPALKDEFNPVQLEDLGKYSKLSIDLMVSKDYHGESLMNIEIPFDNNFITEPRGIKTTVHDKDWKTTLKNDGYSDEVIAFVEDLMNQISSDKFFD